MARCFEFVCSPVLLFITANPCGGASNSCACRLRREKGSNSATASILINVENNANTHPNTDAEDEEDRLLSLPG